MPSSLLTDTDPDPAQIVNWGGTPALMVRRYRPLPRPESKAPISSIRQPQQESKAPAKWDATAPHRLRTLDPLPDTAIWLADDVFVEEARSRKAGIYKAVASAVAALVVLDAGAMLVRSAEASSPRQALSALNSVSPTSLLPPLSLPTSTSSTAPATSTTSLVRKVVTTRTTKAKAITTAVNASGIPAGVPGSPAMWNCIIQHESGGNPRAVNASSGAGGLFQFLPSSWRLYGGSGLPENASVSQQWQIATNAYNRSGFSPWRGDGCV